VVYALQPVPEKFKKSFVQNKHSQNMLRRTTLNIARQTQRSLIVARSFHSTPVVFDKKIPSVTFKTRVRDDKNQGPNPFKWQDVTTEEIFKNKKVIIVALPGAFTPTCSSTHLPGYEAQYDEFKKLGIDEIYCVRYIKTNKTRFL
jgi:hypothetical protein